MTTPSKASTAKTASTKTPSDASKTFNRERDTELDDRLSDAEALMWTLEKDPRLNPNGASLAFFDREIDLDRFRRQLRFGITKMPRLYQKIVPGVGRLTTPRWVPDSNFNLDYHIRVINLGGDADERAVLDLAAQLYQEPLDRTRPLWRFVVVNGLEGGRSAVYSLIHHVVADGVGQLRISELYLQLSRDEGLPPEVDLDALLQADVAADRTDRPDGNLASDLTSTATKTMSYLADQQLKLGRKILGEIMLWPADPERAATALTQAVAVSAGTIEQLVDLVADEEGGSPLWAERSRHRHLEHVRVGMDDLKTASTMLDASINDLFVAGLGEAADRYHRDRDVDVDVFNTSIVVSTRSDGKRSGNAFTPVLIEVPAPAENLTGRINDVKAATVEAVGKARAGVGLQSISGILNLLPTSLLADRAKERAARIDFATSNLRGFPLPVFCAGAKLTKTVIMGPLAGTAMNVTAISFDGNFEIGLFIDPVAIDDPTALRSHVDEVFTEMVAMARPAKPAKKKAATKRAATKKKTAAKKKAPAKKAAATKKAAAAKRKPATKKRG